LFAVNAGSNEISVMRIRRNGLTVASRVSSGGFRPISLTAYGNVLYVLNEGGTPNIAGFTFDNAGVLTPLAGSSRPLTGGAAADPAEVGFSPDGDFLMVTEKATNVIDTYTVGNDGIASGPIANPFKGTTPFGFEFDKRANPIVSEAFGGVPNLAAVSSYRVLASGLLSIVSASVRDLQTAACWIEISKSGRYAYTTNTGSGTVSNYRVRNGALTLINSTAANFGAMSAPTNMDLSTFGRYLYVHAAGLQAIKVLRVELDGSLTPIASAGGLPLGAQGLAAR
jgi:6-phosphogluconolactonase (cycloisomerase 2 family)